VKKKQNITEQIAQFKAGKYKGCDPTWFDWFCSENSLKDKTNLLYKKLINIEKSKKFDSNKTCVFFKNNCPVTGELYDDFRICDSSGVIFTVTPRVGHYGESHRKAQVYGKSNDFKEPLIEGTWKEVVAWFLKEEEKPIPDKTLAEKAHAVIFIELLGKAVVQACEAELYWEATQTIQVVNATFVSNQLNQSDIDLTALTNIAFVMDDEVTILDHLTERFDCLTAKSCPDCWK